jgi:hypothetical protein
VGPESSRGRLGNHQPDPELSRCAGIRSAGIHVGATDETIKNPGIKPETNRPIFNLPIRNLSIFPSFNPKAMTLLKSATPLFYSNDIIAFLNKHPFVKLAINPKGNHLLVSLSLSEEATRIFVQMLEASGHLIVNYTAHTARKEGSISIHTSGEDSGQIKETFSRAFEKVSQYLEYREVSQDYASGYVPTHLSGWLTETHVQPTNPNSHEQA